MFGSKLNNYDKEIEFFTSKLYVKYLVCLRDKATLETTLNKLNLNYRISVHGAIESIEKLTEERFHELRAALANSGLILLNEKESMLIDRIIQTIVEVVHYSDTLPRLNFRDLINDHLVSGNESILKIFSDVMGMSVLQFIVIQKIERAKELLLYEDMSLEEIADVLNYKNIDYLIAQFKKTTGLTPSYFKALKKERMATSTKHVNSSQSDISGAAS